MNIVRLNRLSACINVKTHFADTHVKTSFWVGKFQLLQASTSSKKCETSEGKLTVVCCNCSWFLFSANGGCGGKKTAIGFSVPAFLGSPSHKGFDKLLSQEDSDVDLTDSDVEEFRRPLKTKP